jgi:hypothetical protein
MAKSAAGPGSPGDASNPALGAGVAPHDKAGAPSPATTTQDDAGSLTGLTADEATKIAEEFGDPVPTGPLPTQGQAGAGDGGKTPPGEGGAPPAEQATAKEGEEAGPDAGEKPGQGETPQPLPFDEELAGMKPLGDKPQATDDIPDLSTEEARQKALNPDGKSTVEDQLKNAQKLIGRFSGAVGKAKQLLAEMAPYAQLDERGQVVSFNLVALGDALGKESVDAQLAALGQKLVPLDWGPEQAGLLSDYPPDIVDAVLKRDGSIESGDLSYEEKVELVKSDPGKLVDVRTEKNRRELQAQQEAEQAQRDENDRCAARIQQIAATDKTYPRLKPGISRWNAVLPETIGGGLRAELCYRLAKLDRILDPDFRKAQADSIYRRAEADLITKFNLRVPTGGGGVVPAPGAGGSPGAAGGEEFASATTDEKL